MDDSVSKMEFLNKLQASRAQWEGLLAQLSEEQLTQPGVVGPWSVKDLIAHVTWYEREMVELIEPRSLVGSELWGLPPKERNAAIHQANEKRSLEEVKAEAQSTYRRLLAAVEALSEDELVDPQKYANMPEDWLPWKVIAENSYEHYDEHSQNLSEWLAGTEEA